MRRPVCAPLALLLALWSASTFGFSSQSRTAAPPFTGRVTSVIDGDTIDVVAIDKESTRIRLEGIDCPESGQFFNTVAGNFTRTLLFDKTVAVRTIDADRYGRTVCCKNFTAIFATEDEVPKAGNPSAH